MNLAIIGYGLVRGREPELGLLAKSHYLRIIGYNKPGKMHESGIEVSKNLEFIFPNVKPAFVADPLFAFRKQYDCSSWIYFEDLEKYVAGTDAIITHELWNFFSFQAVKTSKDLQLPSIVIVFETIPRNFLFSFVPPYSRNTKFVTKNADLFVAQTYKARSYLLSLGVSDRKIKVVYPGISNKFTISRSSGRRANYTRILFVGNFIQKGLLILLDAFVKLSSELPRASLWIVGDGPETIKERIRALEKHFPIKFLGIVPHSDMPEVYNEVDLLCMLSQERRILGIKVLAEQFGYALVEAMASGLPIITTNCGAIPEIVGPGNFIVDSRDQSDVVNALRTLLENAQLREIIGQGNAKRAQAIFNAEKQSTLLLSCMSSVVQDNGPEI